MKTRLIGGVIFFLGLMLVIAVGYDYYLDNEKYNRDPRHLSSYVDSGYYRIDPDTILAALARGETNIFTALPEDPNLVEALPNVSFSWTQADYLQVGSALSQSVWKEPMDLKDWSVYQIIFTRHCHSSGFDYGEITYFRIGEVNQQKVYITRHIEIDPYFSMVRWGGGATYPRPIFYKWNGVDLSDAGITADDALRIADENGGDEARLQEGNECRIYLRMPIGQQTNEDSWEVRYIGTQLFDMLIDPHSGEYKVSTPGP